MTDVALLRTPLYDRHVAAGARLVPFAGWEMPVQYAGIAEEHRAVRTGAGIFDVSHMGEVETSGPGAGALLQRLLSNDVDKLAVGGAQYSVLCREDGGVLDDLFTYRLAEDRYLTVTNAANHDKDLAWFQRARRGLRRASSRTGSPTGRCSRSRARRRAAIVEAFAAAPLPARFHCATLARRRPRGARLRHRLHRRGRRRDPLPAAGRGARSGTPRWTAARCPRASARATRCASRSVTTSTATT